MVVLLLFLSFFSSSLFLLILCIEKKPKSVERSPMPQSPSPLPASKEETTPSKNSQPKSKSLSKEINTTDNQEKMETTATDGEFKFDMPLLKTEEAPKTDLRSVEEENPFKRKSVQEKLRQKDGACGVGEVQKTQESERRPGSERKTAKTVASTKTRGR